jgi:hypothetical protein
MAALIDSSVKVSSAAGVLAITSPSWTIGGSNRCVWSSVGNGSGTPSNPTGAKIGGSGGTAMTIQGSTVSVPSYFKHTLYRLIAPASGSTTSYANWGSAQDEVLLISVSTKDTDQTTPNGTIATATANTSLAPSVNATTVAGDLVLDFAFLGNNVGDAPLLTATAGQNPLQEIEGTDTTYEAMGSSYKTASGTSTTMSWSATGSGAQSSWSTMAFAVKAAGGGGGSPLRFNSQLNGLGASGPFFNNPLG